MVTKEGHLVTRQEIIDHLWGNDVFLDTEHGINTAVCKIRHALRDDPDEPRFIQTVTGKGYRFVAEMKNGNGAVSASKQEQASVSEQAILGGNASTGSPAPVGSNRTTVAVVVAL